jgi:hypothetical protein
MSDAVHGPWMGAAGVRSANCTRSGTLGRQHPILHLGWTIAWTVALSRRRRPRSSALCTTWGSAPRGTPKSSRRHAVQRTVDELAGPACRVRGRWNREFGAAIQLCAHGMFLTTF